jgi:DNA-binding transcriptional ArsR family regulator
VGLTPVSSGYATLTGGLGLRAAVGVAGRTRAEMALATTHWPDMHACVRMRNLFCVAHEEYVAAGELLAVLAAPVRLAIITRLAAGPAAVHELSDELGESQPLVSQHLRVLRAARLIRATARGRERIYELVDEHVAHIVHDAVHHTTEAPSKERP